MSKALLIAGLLGLAAATPSPWKQPKQKQCPYLKAIPVNATFDDLTALPITVPLIENEIGNYDYLFWSSFYAASSEVADTSISTTGLIGLIPQSPPNVAASEGATTNVFDTPTLYSNYTGSKTVYFDLKSFYFGCTAVYVPSSGEITPALLINPLTTTAPMAKSTRLKTATSRSKATRVSISSQRRPSTSEATKLAAASSPPTWFLQHSMATSPS
ncbi:hypothetical protein BDY17DRAFT_294940 [Neohortaea acidophila]|uniref:Uncharacterized protein n=1 Tax=Neohortaea acidophila TaxID=245834 RepID=A0A6A6PXX8_9PEZI|nr:uncharacterized protein BDY17DRAFT_294940 [Neohortaea acidophila]KAF2484077.1 hypothetical protein BDY17DRAFT_294940 [Neohortaea acidophila]